MDGDILGALLNNRLFSQVPRADLVTLFADRTVDRFSDGDIVFNAGAPAERVWVLVSGEIALLPGRDAAAMIGRAGPGDSIGEEAAITGTLHGQSARAAQDSIAIAIEVSALRDYLERHFDVAIAMIAAMSGLLRDQVKEITELKMQSTAERLAGYLAALAGAETMGRKVVRLPCEKRLLADQLGMDPATLSRAFAKLREKGVEASRTDKVVIADVDALRRFGDCAMAPT